MIDIARIRRLIKGFDFDGLFEELGWDRFRRALPIVVDGIEYQLTGIREKRGFQVFHYLVPSGQEFPTSEVMTKIQRAVAKSAHENIVVFSDESKTRQCYRIAKREDGKLLRSTGLDFHEGHSGEALAQRLSKLAISLEEEENIELVDVAKRASELFAERATKRFARYRIPRMFNSAIESGRFAVVSSLAPVIRSNSATSSQQRNQLVADLAEQIVVTHAAEGSRTEEFALSLLRDGRVVDCLDGGCKRLVVSGARVIQINSVTGRVSE